jgi:hypothetical protein
MRLVAALAIAALVAGSPAGCGGSGTSESPGSGGQRTGGPTAPAGATARGCGVATARIVGLRIAVASCEEGRRIALRWERASGCQPSAGASRAACSVGRYRCSAVRADRGTAVSCARPGHTVAFIARRAG